MKTGARVLVRLSLILLFSLAAASVHSQTILWSENFDDGNGNNRWYADNGTWQIGSPTVWPQTNVVGGRAYSGANCATTGLTGNYLSYQDSRLIRLATIVVPASSSYPRLRFWQWFSFAGSYYSDSGSYGFLEIKTGTNGWLTISPTYNSASSGVWSRPSMDLTPFAGQTVQVAFHVHSAYNTAAAWNVDDVGVGTGTSLFDNPEGFEFGLEHRLVDHGTWQVDKPSDWQSSVDCGRATVGIHLPSRSIDAVVLRGINLEPL